MLLRRIISAVVLVQYAVVMLAGSALHRHDLHGHAHGGHNHAHAHHGHAHGDSPHSHLAAHEVSCCGDCSAAAAPNTAPLTAGDCLLCNLLSRAKSGHVVLTDDASSVELTSEATILSPPCPAFEPILACSARGPPASA